MSPAREGGFSPATGLLRCPGKVLAQDSRSSRKPLDFIRPNKRPNYRGWYSHSCCSVCVIKQFKVCTAEFCILRDESERLADVALTLEAVASHGAPGGHTLLRTARCCLQGTRHPGKRQNQTKLQKRLNHQKTRDAAWKQGPGSRGKQGLVLRGKQRGFPTLTLPPPPAGLTVLLLQNLFFTFQSPRENASCQ